MKKIFALIAALTLMCSTPAFAAVVSGTVTGIRENDYTLLTSASATTCTSAEVNTNGNLGSLIDAGGQGSGSVTITFYDEGASPTCAAADQLYTGVLLQGQSIPLFIRLHLGLAYKISAALTYNMLFTRT